jgi:hypothetical protein
VCVLVVCVCVVCVCVFVVCVCVCVCVCWSRFRSSYPTDPLSCSASISTSGSNPERLQKVDLAVELWSLFFVTALWVQFFNPQCARFTSFVADGRPISAAAGSEHFGLGLII